MQDESSAIIIPIGQILYSIASNTGSAQRGTVLLRQEGETEKKRYTYDLLGTRETKISRPQDVKKINQIFLNYIGITIVII